MTSSFGKVVSALLVLATTIAVASVISEQEHEVINYRLPKSVLPRHYNLYLNPDITTGHFTGQEVITLHITEATKEIILHSHKLIITSLYVQALDGWMVGETIPVDKYEFDSEREFLIVHMVEELQMDAIITLGIIFEGEMRDKIVGLYSSSYLTPQQQRRNIATTKFEPTYARQAFPCFDEPEMKATFNITVVHPTREYEALSNMNLESTTYWGNFTESNFATSVPMSTYLACIIVSDFQHNKKSVDTHGIGTNFEIRVFATAHQLHKVDFALETAVAVTEYYIQNYKVAYPLPKLDMAAIPDFASNAMEHWGLVTYRETALLYDPDYSSTWNKQSIAAVLAHELAHMWFGNLVTMKWWNDLWLNEGFARYMQYKGIAAVYTDWGMTDQFLIHALQPVLSFDSKTSSHPIVQTVETPDQITEIFDTITYDKGGSVIRMLEHAVGTDNFEKAVTAYLEKFVFGNAITDDFLTEVARLETRFDIKLMMRTWTEQMGFPVVEVERIDQHTFVLKQKRFFSNIADYEVEYEDSEFNYTWTIPLTFYLDKSEVSTSLLFEHNVSSVAIEVPSETRWIKLNVDQIGYYRVNYDYTTWSAIISDLVKDLTTFGTADRGHLLNDAFALADASQLPYEVPLNMTAYLSKELDFVPWYVAAQKLQELQRSLMYTDTYVDYLRYAQNLLKEVYETVTWQVEEDNHLKNRLRVTILTTACALGLPDCLNEAKIRFNNWITGNTTEKPAPDLREVVYYYGMQQLSSTEVWEKMLQHFFEEQDASEKIKLMYGLSAVNDPQLLFRFTQLAEDESYVRRQDYFTCLQNIAANPMGEPIVWEYVREHWPDLLARFGLNDRYLGRMIPTITKNFALEVKLHEMEEFFRKFPEAGAGSASRKQALETVKFNIQWLQQNKVDITNWLSQKLTSL